MKELAAAGKFRVVPADWPELLEEGDRLQCRFCPRTRLGALDAPHLAAARQMGATHFHTFDRNSDPRPCALALGLRLQPRPTKEEQHRAKGL